MKEEEKIMQGKLFEPVEQSLVEMKRVSHNLCMDYNRTYEHETQKRAALLDQILGSHGENVYFQGPIYFNYGKHTKIGNNFFGNYNIMISDDAPVTIGDYVQIGPNCTIATPSHPMIARERRAMTDRTGHTFRPCLAKPVVIGSDVWLAAGVIVCGGVTIGDGAVIGAGSVVTRDIPPNTFAAGNPCRVIRKITEKDTMKEFLL